MTYSTITETGSNRDVCDLVINWKSSVLKLPHSVPDRDVFMIKSAEQLEAATIIIFGGTGDLVRKKLVSALLDLYVGGFLPKSFRIIGFSRRKWDDKEYRTFVRGVINRKDYKHKDEKIESFLKNIFYQQGDFDDSQSYVDLNKCITQLNDTYESCPNKLIYLAVPPSFYQVIFDELCSSGVGHQKDGTWTRLLVEKPFGKDSESAQQLDKKLGSLFEEEQIFRIDHYLAKDAIQNILTFRFANVLFENSWDYRHIEKVHIKLYEDIGVEERASFYDSIGALRDVGQNHMLQMLSLVSMDNPGEFSADTLRQERAKVLNSLQQLSLDDLKQNVIRGQYSGYRDINAELKESETETYFLVKAFLNTKKWKDVPFYLESGKKLKETKTEITIYFKQSTSCLYAGRNLNEYKNVLTMEIAPHQEIKIRFWGKSPGLDNSLEPRDLSFVCDTSTSIPDAYQKVLYDCLSGDQTLFTSTEEVEAAWKFITPILNEWKTIPLEEYVEGSEGPERRNTYFNSDLNT